MVTWRHVRRNPITRGNRDRAAGRHGDRDHQP
jgi:hypothetical protein